MGVYLRGDVFNDNETCTTAEFVVRSVRLCVGGFFSSICLLLAALISLYLCVLIITSPNTLSFRWIGYISLKAIVHIFLS